MWLSYLLFLLVLPLHEVFNLQVGFTLKLFNIFILVSFGIFIFRKLMWGARMPRTPLDFWLWFFFAGNFVSLIVATNHSDGLRIMFAVLFMYLAYYLTTICVNTPERFGKAMKVLAWSALVTSVFGIYQLVGFLMGYETGQVYRPGHSWIPRLQSTMGEPAFFANFLLLSFPILFTYLLHGVYSIFRKWELVFFLVLIFCALVMTMSKGTFLALALAFPICFYGRSFGYALRKTIPVSLVTILFLGSVGIALFSYSSTVFIKYDMNYVIYESLLSPDQGSFVERKEGNATSKSMFLANPILGVGPNNYGNNYNQHKPIWGQFDQFETKLTPNNIILNLLAENGILGFLIFSGMMITLVLRVWNFIKSKRVGSFEHTTMIGLAYCFVSMIVQYLFSAYIYFPHFWVVIGLMIALIAMPDRDPVAVKEPELEAAR